MDIETGPERPIPAPFPHPGAPRRIAETEEFRKISRRVRPGVTIPLGAIELTLDPADQWEPDASPMPPARSWTAELHPSVFDSLGIPTAHRRVVGRATLVELALTRLFVEVERARGVRP